MHFKPVAKVVNHNMDQLKCQMTEWILLKSTLTKHLKQWRYIKQWALFVWIPPLGGLITVHVDSARF